MIKVGDYIRELGEIHIIEKLEMPTEYSYGYAYYHDKEHKNVKYFIEFDIDEENNLVSSQGNKIIYAENWTDLIEINDFVNDKLITDIITKVDHEMTKSERYFVYHTQGYLTSYFKESDVNRLVTHEYYGGGVFNGLKD